MPTQKKPPADPTSGPVAQFGYDLRTLRQKAQLSYPRLAQASFYSVSAVHRADQGHALPSEALTESFVKACGDDPAVWLKRRNEITADVEAGKPPAEPKLTPKTRGLAAPDPTEVTNSIEYIDALKRLREWSGMTYREMAKVAAEYARPLKASTVCAALGRGTLPQRDLVASFVRAAGLVEADELIWLEVRDALADGRPVPRGPAWKRWATGGRQVVARSNLRKIPVEDDVVVIEDDVVPVGELLNNPVRDWVLINGRWESTDGRPPRKRRPWASALASVVTTVGAIKPLPWPWRRRR
jgi:hypothetical protein